MRPFLFMCSRAVRLLPACVALFTAAASAFAADDGAALVDVFTSGSDGYHTYRIPAIVVTTKGTLLAFCEGRKTSRSDHGDVDLVLRRSFDGGKTWQAMQLVYEEGGTEKVTIGNPCPVVDRDTGTIWLPFCRDNNDVFVTSSTDDGKTWAAPRNITSDVKKPDWSWYATGPVNGIQLAHGPHKGRLIFPCDHRVKDSSNYKRSGGSHMIYSDDHGATWKLGGVSDPGMNECTVAELADGTLVLNMRNYRGTARRAVATSTDGGETWSPCVDHPTLVESVCQGSLLAIPGDITGAPTRLLFCNPATEKGRHHLTLRVSDDGGKTWPVSRLIYEGSSAYSCLTRLPDGQIGLIFERDDYKRISFERLPVTFR
jgi:sialidase-1